MKQNVAKVVPSVLVVDDSLAQRKLVVTLLRRWGYDVREAASGADALALCEAHPPDLILSDWIMPGLSGIEFCEAFRALPGNSYGYFILLTSKSDKQDIARGLDAGADDFLSKPVASAELRARLTAGERILSMQHSLIQKNAVIADTLAELQTVYDSLDRDLREAKNLQQSLLPERSKRFDQGMLNLLLRSSGHLGGDLVGFYQAGAAELGVFAIDVSGHGISSALMTARLAGYLSGRAADHNIALAVGPDGEIKLRPPMDVMIELNARVLQEVETDHYFTLMLAHIDLQSGDVVIGQAGHPHPIIQRKSGKIEQNGQGGFPVGLLPDAQFSQMHLSLAAGDRLIILSDGVTECEDPHGALLGEAGVEKMLVPLAGVRGNDFFDALQEQLIDFAGHGDFADDISGIVFEYGQ